MLNRRRFIGLAAAAGAAAAGAAALVPSPVRGLRLPGGSAARILVLGGTASWARTWWARRCSAGTG
jgi:hypothetical protein